MHMGIKTAVSEAMASLPPPTNAEHSLPELTTPSDKPKSPQGGIGSWSSLASCLSEHDSAEFRQRFIGLDEAHHQKVAALARWTERWIKAASTNARPARWIVFCGKAGTGKSHALKAAHAFLRDRGGALWPTWWKAGPPSVRMATWSKVVGVTQGHWADFEEEVHAARFVLLDDVGSETDRFKTGEPTERLRLVLDLCRTKWLMISTNLTRETFAKAFDPRIQSRLEQASVLEMSGVPDYRPKLREAN